MQGLKQIETIKNKWKTSGNFYKRIVVQKGLQVIE